MDNGLLGRDAPKARAGEHASLPHSHAGRQATFLIALWWSPRFSCLSHRVHAEPFRMYAACPSLRAIQPQEVVANVSRQHQVLSPLH